MNINGEFSIKAREDDELVVELRAAGVGRRKDWFQQNKEWIEACRTTNRVGRPGTLERAVARVKLQLV